MVKKTEKASLAGKMRNKNMQLGAKALNILETFLQPNHALGAIGPTVLRF